MLQFEFETDDKSRTFIEDIVKEMMDLFSITRDEAVGRMNRLWRGQSFGGPEEVIFHEDEEYWAKTIYYGKESLWWKNPPDLKPLPYPSDAD